MALASMRSARRIFRPGSRSAASGPNSGGQDVEKETLEDRKTGRKCYLDLPSDHADGEEVTFILNLHGGGSVGAWQREYFPAYDYVDAYRLVIATPSAATKEPIRHWAAGPDDEYLADLVEAVVERFGARNIRSFWLVGHSQGGMTSNRLLSTNLYFADRVDGWLSLSGGRLGLSAERAADAGPPRSEAERARMQEVFAGGRIFEPPPLPTAEFSFIYATGEHEFASFPETSPWAERYGAEARVRMPDIVDTQPGRIHDGRFDENPTKSWGRKPAPGTAQVYVFPNAKHGRLIADVVRLDKGHTEGLEPRLTEELIKLMVSAPGGKLRTEGTWLGADSVPG
jgi:pimeloyl-ACP methyl ester carboxylesterase